eukprot:6204542-Pleurochrysis_carterae.AAC.2
MNCSHRRRPKQKAEKDTQELKEARETIARDGEELVYVRERASGDRRARAISSCSMQKQPQ